DRGGNTGAAFDLMEPVTVELDYVVRSEIPGAHLQVDVRHHGDCVFSTWDTDTSPERFQRRPPGTYRMRFQIPVPLLKAGRYQLWAGMGIANTRSVHPPEEMLAFDVEEHSVATSLLSYAQRRPGRLVVPLPWTCEPLPSVE